MGKSSMVSDFNDSESEVKNPMMPSTTKKNHRVSFAEDVKDKNGGKNAKISFELQQEETQKVKSDSLCGSCIIA
jgi:hypothetical protein